jgi:hypothetical protein
LVPLESADSDTSRVVHPARFTAAAETAAAHQRVVRPPLWPGLDPGLLVVDPPGVLPGLLVVDPPCALPGVLVVEGWLDGVDGLDGVEGWLDGVGRSLLTGSSFTPPPSRRRS